MIKNSSDSARYTYPLFIHFIGFHGAAIATLLSQVICLLFILAYLKKKNLFSFRLSAFERKEVLPSNGFEYGLDHDHWAVRWRQTLAYLLSNLDYGLNGIWAAVLASHVVASVAAAATGTMTIKAVEK